MNKFAQQLQKHLVTAVQQSYDLDVHADRVVLERPKDEAHGDYATNIALQLSKQLGKNPREIAQAIVDNFEIFEGVEKLKVAGPGFINFTITTEHLAAIVEDVDEAYGMSDMFVNEKHIFEFTDPNPFKEFHIGHLYSNTVGESLSRIYESLGAEVRRADYFGDVGMHVAKSVWGLIKIMKQEALQLKDVEKKSIQERAQFLGRAYAFGATSFKEDENAKSEITEINKIIAQAGQKFYQEKYKKKRIVDYSKLKGGSTFSFDEISNIYYQGRKWSLDYFETIYKRVGMSFDLYYPESVAAEIGYQFVQKGIKKGVFEESDGAIVYSQEKNGLHTRVFMNSLGIPTYEAKELGLAPAKFKDYPYDQSTIITGNEIDEYFKVLLKALKELQPELAEKTKHMSHGMVRLPEGKMSSRTGKIITGMNFMDDVRDSVLKKMADSELSKEKKQETAEIIGQAAFKYAFLKHSIGGDIIFDFSTSLSLEGDSGPYILYTYTRAKSILREVSEIPGNTLTLEHEKEIDVARWIERYPEIVQKAAQNYAPNHICEYVFELAQRFNKFYGELSVLNADTEQQKYSRLILTQATAQVIKNALGLLGIKTVEKM